ncbi:MAG: CPBP family intramembrane metalloprotease [Chlorobi bacterium]|nr:CPBP family intramembrane metalloprotease [Chlorobiota bacterium]
MVSNYKLRLIIVFLLLAIGVLGLTLRLVFVSPDLDFLFQVQSSDFIVGISTGIISAIIMGLISSLPVFKEVRETLIPAIKVFSSPPWFAFLVSLFAGVCEELFFRAFLQELIGLIPTAILFVAIHGYYFPKPRAMPLLGILVTFIAVALGLLYEHFGFWAAASMHFAYDFVLLLATLKFKTCESNNSDGWENVN